MPDSRFFKTNPPLSAADALTRARALDSKAELVSDGASEATHAAPASADDLHGALIFCLDKAKAMSLQNKPFGLCVAPPTVAASFQGGEAVLATEQAKPVFALLASALHEPLIWEKSGTPSIGDDTSVHPTAVLDATAEIGAGAQIGPYCVIGPGVSIGAGAHIGSHVTIGFSLIGDRARILSGARLGEDGFGFAPAASGLVRMPQLGRVMLGDDVEIGANATIDRGTLGDTTIGPGTKIDNLVHIGHNVRVGAHCVVAAQSGFSGSCVIGDGVMIGGQVGLADHITIGAGAKIAAQSGVITDIPAGTSWGGTPATPGRAWLRAAVEARRAKRTKKTEEQ